jgi:hypothetical protein
MSRGGFKRQYPEKGRILFDGGLDTKFEVSLIPDNESPDCANVVFNNGSVATRQGAIKLNTNAVSAQTFTGIYTRRANDGTSETMIVWAGTDMFTLNTTTFVTVPSAQGIFQVGNRITTAQYQNYMFIGQSGTTAYKWDGTYFTRHGVPAPTATATVASAGVAGALTASGEYRYKVTYVNSALVESDVGPVTSTFVISTTSGQNTVSNIPVAPVSFGVAQRRLYRNANGGTTFKLVTTIADNSTTSYTDNVADGALGANAPSDNGVPPKYSAIIYHNNRLFMNDTANPNYVWYSSLNTPYTVPSNNFIRVGDNTSDLVKGFGVYENSLIVYCERSIWMVYMYDSTDTNWKPIRVKSPFGSKSPHCVIDYNNRQLTPSVQNQKFVGFGAIIGNVDDPSATALTAFTAGSELKSDRIEPDMFNVQESYLGNISGIVFKNKAYISMAYGSGQTTNNRIYVFDFSLSNLRKSQEASWVPWTGLAAEQFTIYGGNLYFCSSTSGFVYRLEGGTYSDDGSAINSYYWTKEFSGTDPEFNFYKDWRYAQLLIDTSGSYYMNIRYRVDSDKGSGATEQINLAPGGSLWGAMVWGRDLWGGGSNQKEVRVYFGSLRGKRIQIRFDNQNTADQRFKVHGMNLFYNLKGPR